MIHELAHSSLLRTLIRDVGEIYEWLLQSIRFPVTSFIVLPLLVSEASCYQAAIGQEHELSLNADSDYAEMITIKNSAAINHGLNLVIQLHGSFVLNSAPEKVTPQSGTPVEFNLLLQDSKGHTFQDPLALLAVRDRNDVHTQNLYIILQDEQVGFDTKYALGEIKVFMDRLPDGPGAVTPGRVFSLPVHSGFNTAKLTVDADKGRLYVSIEELTDYPGQPVTMIFDISPGSSRLEPINILTAPRQ